jgi:hypothetical protein
VPEEEKALIVGGNTASLFGVGLGALASPD